MGIFENTKNPNSLQEERAKEKEMAEKRQNFDFLNEGEFLKAKKLKEQEKLELLRNWEHSFGGDEMGCKIQGDERVYYPSDMD
jgi:hypothetical protein